MFYWNLFFKLGTKYLKKVFDTWKFNQYLSKAFLLGFTSIVKLSLIYLTSKISRYLISAPSFLNPWLIGEKELVWLIYNPTFFKSAQPLSPDTCSTAFRRNLLRL